MAKFRSCIGRCLYSVFALNVWIRFGCEKKRLCQRDGYVLSFSRLESEEAMNFCRKQNKNHPSGKGACQSGLFLGTVLSILDVRFPIYGKSRTVPILCRITNAIKL